MKFSKKKFWEVAILKNSVFLVCHFGFFLKEKKMLHPHENQSKLLGYQGWVEILILIILVVLNQLKKLLVTVD